MITIKNKDELAELKKAQCSQCKTLHSLSSFSISELRKGKTLHWTRFYSDCDKCAESIANAEERTHD